MGLLALLIFSTKIVQGLEEIKKKKKLELSLLSC